MTTKEQLRATTDAIVLFSDAVNDLEQIRIATGNRIWALAEIKGAADTYESKRLESLKKDLEGLERKAIRDLERAVKQHPIYEWMENEPGISPKLVGRFIGAVGDPCTRPNPAKLWAYAGLHTINGAAPRLRKDEQATYNPVARARAYLLAESAMRFTGKNGHRDRSKYRDIYDNAKQKWVNEGKGNDDGHRHAHALRKVASAIVLDIWKQSRKAAGLSYNKNRGSD